MKEKLYAASPVWLQNLMCDAVGVGVHRRRYGRGWGEVWRQVQAAGELPQGALRELRAEKLRHQFLAASTAPFWARRFAEYGLDINGSDPHSELAKLPVLTKAEVRANANALQPRGITKATMPVQTSGSTGSPLRFRYTREAHQEQWAVWWRYRSWHGLQPGDWHAVFGGKMIVPRSTNSPPYWRRIRPDRRWYFSSFHLSENTAASYVAAVEKYGLTWLHGYPSALSTLASLGDRDALAQLRLRVVTTGAETLLPTQRRLVEERFDCPVRQHYGLAEGVANISECENGILHVDEDFSYVEFVPVKGQASSFSIVGTNLSNPAFPLFRYDTGDIATLLPGSSCSCGRSGRVVSSIDGRMDDTVILGDGTRVGRLSLIFTPLASIREAQIIQERVGAVRILVARDEGYDSGGVESRLLAGARDRLGSECEIEVEYVDAVPRTASGKVRLVVSHLERTNPIK